jgi:hypothetical protein
MMKLVIVEWQDVFKMMSDDYYDPNVDVDKRLVNFTTVGWVIQESKKTLMLVQEFDDRERPHDWVVIPKSLIRKIVVVKYAE